MTSRQSLWRIASYEGSRHTKRYFIRGLAAGLPDLPAIIACPMPHHDGEALVSTKVVNAFYDRLQQSKPSVETVGKAALESLNIEANAPDLNGSRYVEGMIFTVIYCQEEAQIFTIGSDLVLLISNGIANDLIEPDGPPLPWGQTVALPDHKCTAGIRTGTFEGHSGQQLLIAPASSVGRPIRPTLSDGPFYRRVLAALAAPYHSYSDAFLLLEPN